jgi:hypothetical protein
MSIALQHSVAAPRRAAFLVVFALAAALAGCGGSDGTTVINTTTPPPAGPTGTLTGTAAKGTAIAGATVTVKDSTGKTATATTSSTGTYTVDTSGMTAPLLVQTAPATGPKIYSVTGDTKTTTVANITPLTDLIIRSWYNVQGINIDTAFASPTTAPPPTPLQVQTIAQMVLQVMQLSLNTYSVSLASAIELITKPFVANGAGMDLVLDKTTVTAAGSTITLVAIGTGGTTQTTVVSYNTTTASLTADTTTVNGSNTTTSSVSTAVPVQSAQVTALQQITTSLASFGAVVNSKGTALTVTDVLPFTDANLLDEGRNRTQFATSVVGNFNEGVTVAFEILQIKSLDATAGLAEVTFRLNETFGTQTGSEILTFNFKRTGTSWLFYGNRRVAQFSLQAEGRSNQGAQSSGNGPSINVDVQPPQGVATAVSVAGASANSALTKQSQAVIDDSGLLLDHYFYNTGPLSGTLPAAGSLYTVTISLAAGGTAAYPTPLNAFTTELISITNLTGTTVASAHLGGTLAVNWGLPVTYAVSRVKLSAIIESASFQCEVSTTPSVLANTATSGSLAMPTTCGGEPITQVNINLSTEGPNGERSQTIYFYN